MSMQDVCAGDCFSSRAGREGIAGKVKGYLPLRFEAPELASSGDLFIFDFQCHSSCQKICAKGQRTLAVLSIHCFPLRINNFVLTCRTQDLELLP